MYKRRKFATEDDIRMTKHVFVEWKMRKKNAALFLKIAATFAVLNEHLEVFVFFVNRKMMLVPSLMCILIPLSALLCSGKFDTVAELFFVAICNTQQFLFSCNIF